MKKVFLSLAVIAALTVVSCKDKAAEAPVEETPAVEAAPVEAAPVVEDTAKVAAPAEATPAAAPATEEVKK
jgi:PBP1b-binding outer membrane lipoprotein LpoB